MLQQPVGACINTNSDKSKLTYINKETFDEPSKAENLRSFMH